MVLENALIDLHSPSIDLSLSFILGSKETAHLLWTLLHALLMSSSLLLATRLPLSWSLLTYLWYSSLYW